MAVFQRNIDSLEDVEFYSWNGYKFRQHSLTDSGFEYAVVCNKKKASQKNQARTNDIIRDFDRKSAMIKRLQMKNQLKQLSKALEDK